MSGINGDSTVVGVKAYDVKSEESEMADVDALENAFTKMMTLDDLIKEAEIDNCDEETLQGFRKAKELCKLKNLKVVVTVMKYTWGTEENENAAQEESKQMGTSTEDEEPVPAKKAKLA